MKQHTRSYNRGILPFVHTEESKASTQDFFFPLRTVFTSGPLLKKKKNHKLYSLYGSGDNSRQRLLFRSQSESCRKICNGKVTTARRNNVCSPQDVFCSAQSSHAWTEKAFPTFCKKNTELDGSLLLRGWVFYGRGSR